MKHVLTRPIVGRPAPSVLARTSVGEQWDLGAQLGKPVVLIFHRHIH